MQQEIPFQHTRQLNLQRPLALFDLETTGTDKKSDRIIEIAILKIFPDGHEEQFYSLVNPQRLIPPEASAVHGITDEQVAHAPSFLQLAPSIQEFLNNCDLGGFNCYKFDIPLLMIEFERAGILFTMTDRHVVDVMAIYHRLRPRDLSNAYREFCGKELKDAHSAMADIRATLEVLQAQVQQTPELPPTVQGLQDFCGLPVIFDPTGKLLLNKDGYILINFGKYRGRTIIELLNSDPEYLRWLAAKILSENLRQKIIQRHPELCEIFCG